MVCVCVCVLLWFYYPAGLGSIGVLLCREKWRGGERERFPTDARSHDGDCFIPNTHRPMVGLPRQEVDPENQSETS